MLNNSHVVISAADKAQMKDLVTQLAKLLTPYLLPLTPDERKSVLKLSQGQLSFIDKVIEYANSNPTLLPPGFDLAEAQRDYAALQDLQEVFRPLERLLYDCESTMMLTGGDVFDAALLVLAQTKLNVRNGLVGAQAAHNAMTEHYPKRGRRQKL